MLALCPFYSRNHSGLAKKIFLCHVNGTRLQNSRSCEEWFVDVCCQSHIYIYKEVVLLINSLSFVLSRVPFHGLVMFDGSTAQTGSILVPRRKVPRSFSTLEQALGSYPLCPSELNFCPHAQAPFPQRNDLLQRQTSLFDTVGPLGAYPLSEMPGMVRAPSAKCSLAPMGGS